MIHSSSLIHIRSSPVGPQPERKYFDCLPCLTLPQAFTAPTAKQPPTCDACLLLRTRQHSPNLSIVHAAASRQHPRGDTNDASSPHPQYRLLIPKTPRKQTSEEDKYQQQRPCQEKTQRRALAASGDWPTSTSPAMKATGLVVLTSLSPSPAPLISRAQLLQE